MGIRRKLIRIQNEAAKSGKYINLAEAASRMKKAEEEAQKEKFSNKRK